MLCVRGMPAPFPHHYETRLVRTLSSRARIEAPQRAAIAGGPSPEFDGDATSWSAEHLLLSSIGLSLLQTFEALAAVDGIDLLAWDAVVSGTLARNSQGLELTRFHVDIHVEVSDVERARQALTDAQRHCAVSKVLRTPIEIDATILPIASGLAG